MAGEAVEGEAGESVRTLTLADGTLTLCGEDGALRYRDPESGALLQSKKRLKDIKEFCGEDETTLQNASFTLV